MSAHRQHTLDIPSNPTPLEQMPYRHHEERSMLVWPIAVLAVAAITFGLLYAAILHAGSPLVEISPVRQAQAEAAPLEPTQVLDGAQLAQIRVEAFRAGMQSAQENCFGAPVLSMPIAPRQ